jgi:hypothetical protein
MKRLALLAAFVTLAWSSSAWPCAVARRSPMDRVQTMQEEALIVWDDTHHTEHFIRSAVFDTNAKSFAFLVPTPTVPTLAEADDSVFDILAEATAPHVEYIPQYVPDPIGCTSGLLPSGLRYHGGWVSAPAPDVRVLRQERVAGLDATVLATSNTTALADWLRDRGFEMRPALERWIATYVAKDWNIVAFRYERPLLAANGPVPGDPFASRAVRISFAAPAPVYPYLEPDDVEAVPWRSLRLFVIADRRLEGVLADVGGRSWDAREPFAASTDISGLLLKALPGLTLPDHSWVHDFADSTKKRAASDLVFHPSASVEEIRRPDVLQRHEIDYYVPYELPFVAAALIWWWRRRARKQPTLLAR